MAPSALISQRAPCSLPDVHHYCVVCARGGGESLQVQVQAAGSSQSAVIIIQQQQPLGHGNLVSQKLRSRLSEGC